ncbi:hypothetical protein C6P40_000753 [Pichia californica]|uniref:Trafficking protein particle complex subunit n=1 Tax=Pichia californica TaxID=460514 RepID=A0A9P6WM03_9ASCO|nr:hypothetical protein C6P40_000753 [[Candida] californica]
MQIRFVSLISRDNRPLYIQAFVGEEAKDTQVSSKEEEINELLKYNFLSHMSLDVFESPFAPVGTHSSQGKPTLLFVQDGILVYGSETLTGLKIVVGCSRYNPNNKFTEENNTNEKTVVSKITDEKSLGSLEGFADTDMIEISDLEPVTNAIKKEYIRYSCNPFLDPKEETEIKSDKFDKRIKDIVNNFNLSSI